MDPAMPDLDAELSGVDQVAIVVEDLKDGVDRCLAVLGTEPWMSTGLCPGAYRHNLPR